MHVDILVEDPGNYTEPWHSYMEYVWPSERNGGDPEDAEFIEMACSENNVDPMGVEYDIPVDNGPSAF